MIGQPQGGLGGLLNAPIARSMPQANPQLQQLQQLQMMQRMQPQQQPAMQPPMHAPQQMPQMPQQAPQGLGRMLEQVPQQLGKLTPVNPQRGLGSMMTVGQEGGEKGWDGLDREDQRFYRDAGKDFQDRADETEERERIRHELKRGDLPREERERLEARLKQIDDNRRFEESYGQKPGKDDGTSYTQRDYEERERQRVEMNRRREYREGYVREKQEYEDRYAELMAESDNVETRFFEEKERLTALYRDGRLSHEDYIKGLDAAYEKSVREIEANRRAVAEWRADEPEDWSQEDYYGR